MSRDPRWKSVRRQALARDGYRCRVCGQPADEVHHLTPVHIDHSEANELDLAGVISVCKTHHDEAHADERRQAIADRGLAARPPAFAAWDRRRAQLVADAETAMAEHDAPD